MPRPWRLPHALALVSAVAIAVAAGVGLATTMGAADAPHTLVLVVLDTVRAGNAGACGYPRPTTPFLEELREQDGVSWTCRAYAPGTWTLPSHASYFTGLTVPEHGIGQYLLALGAEHATIAEVLRGRGYQTAMVSGNPSLTAETGITRGFEHVTVATLDAPLIGKGLVRAVHRTLGAVDPDRPLFLFVNVYDAHDPYPAIPAGVAWAAPQEPLRLFAADATTARRPFTRYTHGEMSAEEAEPFLEAVRNGYDYGILRADRTLRLVFDALAAAGRFGRSHRWVVTSDHGEFLGEHRNLRHGSFVFEEVTRIPLWTRDSALPTRELPSPFPALGVHRLLLDGTTPDTPPSSFSIRHGGGRPSATMVALWASEHDKLVWRDGELLRYDLAADPTESAPVPLGAHALRPELERLAAAHERGLKDQVEGSPALRALLVELGYLDPDGTAASAEE